MAGAAIEINAGCASPATTGPGSTLAALGVVFLVGEATGVHLF